MKNIVIALLIVASLSSCVNTQNTSKKTPVVNTNDSMDTIRIVNEELEYEIIIFEIGFESWLFTQKPMTYYSNNTLAIRNNFNVVEWNLRVLEPSRYDPNLYEQQINYDPLIDYGIEVNYKLFMYFKFFQERFNQNL